MLYAEAVNPEQNSVRKRISIKNTKIKCNSCASPLGELIETEPKLNGNVEITHQYLCPCGGESFIVKSKYNAYFHSDAKYIVTSIANVGNNRFKSTLEEHHEKSDTDTL